MRSLQSLKTSRQPPRIFISYSHVDKKYTEELSDHFGILSRLKKTAIWYDREIKAGAAVDDVILTHLRNSDIILLMVSPYFVKSDYCWDIEMRFALERHQSGNCIVVPIIVKPTPQWQKASFGKLLAMSPDGKPITSFKSRALAYEQIVTGIFKLLSGTAGSKPVLTENLVKWELTVRRTKKGIRTEPIDFLLENKLIRLCKDMSITCIGSLPRKGKYVFTSTLKSINKIINLQRKDPDFLSAVGIRIENIEQKLGALINFGIQMKNKTGTPVTTSTKPVRMAPLNKPPLTEAILQGLEFSFSNPRPDKMLQIGLNLGLLHGAKYSENDQQELQARLTRYLFTLTKVPWDDVHVNLSPLLKNAGVPESIVNTEYGRDLLAIDFLLKKCVVDIIDPDTVLGKEYWSIFEASCNDKNFVNPIFRVWLTPAKTMVSEKMEKDKNIVTIDKLDFNVLCDIERESDTSTPNSLKPLFKFFGEKVVPEIKRRIGHEREYVHFLQLLTVAVFASYLQKKLPQIVKKTKQLPAVYKVPGCRQEINKIHRQYKAAFKNGFFRRTIFSINEDTGATVKKVYFSGGIDFIESKTRNS